MGRDLQMDEWAADTTPDMRALQQLLSNPDYQRADGRKYGLSAGVGAEASERRGTLVQKPRE